MSGTMRIRFADDMPIAAVEVLSPEFETVAQIAVRPGTEEKVEVPSGGSFIRVHLPSGRSVTLRHPGNLDYVIDRSELEAKLGCRLPVTPRPPQSVHEVKGYHEFRSSSKRLSASTGGLPLPPDLFGVDRPPIDPLGIVPVLSGGIVVEWTPPVAGQLSLDEHELASMPEKRDRPYTLRVNVQGTTLIVRLPGYLDGAYVRVSELGSGGRILSVRVSTKSDIADTVGSYLHRGDYYAAETMATPWAYQAKELMRGKIEDPYSATVGAYLLLRLERYDLMHDWARNLADWFEFLTDGAIIWAWQNIRQGENYDEAAKYLLKAAADDRDLPLHTEGLRLLSEGLRRIGEPAEEALKNVTSKAGNVVWNSPFTARLEGSPDPKAMPTTYDIDYMPVA